MSVGRVIARGVRTRSTYHQFARNALNTRPKRPNTEREPDTGQLQPTTVDAMSLYLDDTGRKILTALDPSQSWEQRAVLTVVLPKGRQGSTYADTRGE
jgi:hypothetical protein